MRMIYQYKVLLVLSIVFFLSSLWMCVILYGVSVTDIIGFPAEGPFFAEQWNFKENGAHAFSCVNAEVYHIASEEDEWARVAGNLDKSHELSRGSAFDWAVKQIFTTVQQGSNISTHLFNSFLDYHHSTSSENDDGFNFPREHIMKTNPEPARTVEAGHFFKLRRDLRGFTARINRISRCLARLGKSLISFLSVVINGLQSFGAKLERGGSQERSWFRKAWA